MKYVIWMLLTITILGCQAPAESGAETFNSDPSGGGANNGTSCAFDTLTTNGLHAADPNRTAYQCEYEDASLAANNTLSYDAQGSPIGAVFLMFFTDGGGANYHSGKLMYPLVAPWDPATYLLYGGWFVDSQCNLNIVTDFRPQMASSKMTLVNPILNSNGTLKEVTAHSFEDGKTFLLHNCQILAASTL